MSPFPNNSWTRRNFLLHSAAAVTPAFIGLSTPVYGESEKQETEIIRGVPRRQAQGISEIVQAYMETYSVPGMSIAMAYRGKLKLIGCFGFADKENNQMVQPENVFRIASVSKPITSATVMKLEESGKLSLSDRVLGKDGYLNSIYDIQNLTDKENRNRLEQITIQHLLEHTAGGWGNKKNDPMFLPEGLPMNQHELISWVLETIPLEKMPGESYDYSNFGYCLLGRVIEKVTGQSYEEAVQQLILKPSGVKNMAIAKEKHRDQLPNEVVYYGKNEGPYNEYMNVRRMDSHGGWVASPADLVRFAIHVDGFTSPRDILTEESIRKMTETSKANQFYAKGWSVNKYNNWWHMGGFSGSSSILARIHDGHCWAVISNSRSPRKEFSGAFDGLPWKIKNSVNKWGNHDLFRNME